MDPAVRAPLSRTSIITPLLAAQEEAKGKSAIRKRLRTYTCDTRQYITSHLEPPDKSTSRAVLGQLSSTWGLALGGVKCITDNNTPRCRECPKARRTLTRTHICRSRKTWVLSRTGVPQRKLRSMSARGAHGSNHIRVQHAPCSRYAARQCQHAR